jgi:hypothetical protein
VPFDPYGYVLNRPLIGVDPSGHAIELTITIGKIKAGNPAILGPCGGAAFYVCWQLTGATNATVIQEVTYTFNAKDCRTGKFIVVPGIEHHVEHFWEAWDYNSQRKTGNNWDVTMGCDRFGSREYGPCTYGSTEIQGIVKVFDKRVIYDKDGNRVRPWDNKKIPLSGGVSATREKPPGWDNVKGVKHAFTVEWDCCGIPFGVMFHTRITKIEPKPSRK